MQKRWFLAVMLLSLLSQASVLGPTYTPQKVTLEALMVTPEAYKNMPVIITIRFHKPAAIYNAFFTTFSQETHANFSAWGLETPLWKQEQLLNDFSYFYLPKEIPAYKTFFRLEKFEQVEATVIVRAIFEKFPYIEIVDLDTRKTDLTEEMLTGVYQAERLCKNGEWEAAKTALQKLFDQHCYPPDIASELYCRLAECHLRQLKYEKAEDCLGEALDNECDNPWATAMRKKLKSILKEEEKLEDAGKKRPRTTADFFPST